MGGYANNRYGSNGFGQADVHGERTDPYANRDDRYAGQGSGFDYANGIAQGDIRLGWQIGGGLASADYAAQTAGIECAARVPVAIPTLVTL